MLRKIRLFLADWGAIASIVGVLALLFVRGAQRQAELALWLIGATALVLIVLAMETAWTYLHQSCPKGFNAIASFSRYQTNNGRQIVYEIYKVVQARRPWISEYVHEYFWTGSTPPIISSEMQDIWESSQGRKTRVFPSRTSV